MMPVLAGVLGGGSSSILYLIKTLFSGASDQSITNQQVLDTAAEGVIVGSLTARVANGTQSITSGKLVQAVGTLLRSWNNGSGVNTTSSFARANGRIIKFAGVQSNSSDNYSILGAEGDAFNGRSGTTPPSEPATQTGEGNCGAMLRAGGLITYDEAYSTEPLWSANAPFDTAILLKTVGCVHFAKPNGGVWKIMRIVDVGNTANLYAEAQSTQNTTTIENIRVTDDLYPNMLTALATMTNETAVTATNDVVLYGSYAAVTSQTLVIEWRRDGDGQNCWRLKIAQGVSNNVTLHTVTAGVESAALVTGSHSNANGSVNLPQIHHEGTSRIYVYINGFRIIAYTASNTHQQNGTGAKLTLGTISTVSIAAYPLKSGYDAILDAV